MSKQFTVTFADQPGHTDTGLVFDDGSVSVYCPNAPYTKYPYASEAELREAAKEIGGVIHMEGEEQAVGELQRFVIKYRNDGHQEEGVVFPNGHVAATCEHMDVPQSFGSMDVLRQRFKAIFGEDTGAYSIEWVA